MSWKQHDTKQWRRIDKSIDTWLNARQQLLILFYRLLKVHPCDDDHQESDGAMLQDFCQISIDYVSAGHFEIFEKISEASEYSHNQGLNKELLINILRTTVLAMDFSSKYENNTDHTSLTKDLSNLGEALAKRMDWEDELIQIYISATKSLATVTALRKTG